MKQYRIRTFVLWGYSSETEPKPAGGGFERSVKPANGPTIRCIINNRNGKYEEVGEMTTGGTSWRKIFAMNLVKQ